MRERGHKISVADIIRNDFKFVNERKHHVDMDGWHKRFTFHHTSPTYWHIYLNKFLTNQNKVELMCGPDVSPRATLAGEFPFEVKFMREKLNFLQTHINKNESPSICEWKFCDSLFAYHLFCAWKAINSPSISENIQTKEKCVRSSKSLADIIRKHKQ